MSKEELEKLEREKYVVERTFPFEPSKHWFHKNRVQSTLNMDC